MTGFEKAIDNNLAKGSHARDDLRRDARHHLLESRERFFAHLGPRGSGGVPTNRPDSDRSLRFTRGCAPRNAREQTVDSTIGQCEPPPPETVRHLARRHGRFAASAWRWGAQQAATRMPNSSVHRQSAAMMPRAERRRIDASRRRRIRSDGRRTSVDRRDDRLFLTVRRLERQQKWCA